MSGCSPVHTTIVLPLLLHREKDATVHTCVSVTTKSTLNCTKFLLTLR